MQFDDSEKQTLNRFLENIKGSPITAVSSMQALWSVAEDDARALIQRILALDPLEFGFRGEKINDGALPNNAVRIDDNQYIHNGEYSLDPEAYLPAPVYAAFDKMRQDYVQANPGRKLLVGSGYRSPAFQIVTLVYILAKIYEYDIYKTLRRVALPQYSQHCSVTETAIDMMNIDGQPTDEDSEAFKNSVEYQWLTQSANNYDFYESYPPDNPAGIIWEPWHWQYRPK